MPCSEAEKKKRERDTPPLVRTHSGCKHPRPSDCATDGGGGNSGGGGGGGDDSSCLKKSRVVEPYTRYTSPSDFNGGQGESLVPPYTRRSGPLSLSGFGCI